MADFKAKLLAEMNRKRKQVDKFVTEVEGKKVIRQSDVEENREREYLEKQRQKISYQTEQENDLNALASTSSTSSDQPIKEQHRNLPLVEIHKKLRLRGQPIKLFGEDEEAVRERLLQLEIEQPDLKEGWNNELVTAMQSVDNELVKEVIEGSSGNARRHDVLMPGENEDDWETIEQQATLLGVGDDGKRDCDIILSIFRCVLNMWAKRLNDRDDEEKKSLKGKYDASIHKQTWMHLKPLLTSLERHTCNHDIRAHLARICRILVLDRNYLVANTAYMEMAIGNAPWPVGVTRSGIHQRPGSAKSYVSNIAHVLNDETQRKYIQAIKRLMTRMQEYFPTDPSKCVEFVRTDEQ